MSVFLVTSGIILLLLLIIVFRINAFISFIVISILAGIAAGMPVKAVIGSLEKGLGDTLGSLVMILIFGAMLGKIVAESGAAQRITSGLTNLFGIKRIQLALIITGFIVGIPLFYSVGFVVLVPIVFTIAASTGLPLLFVGLPMLASLSVTHGLLPPHPSPTAIAAMFGADIGKTILYGILISIPVIFVAGFLFSRSVKKFKASPISDFVNNGIIKDEDMPGIGSSILIALLPVILIGIATISGMIFDETNKIRIILEFTGDPVIAMLISLGAAVYFLGVVKGKKVSGIMDSITHAAGSIIMVLLIIAGAGGFKQVLVDSGLSDSIAKLLSQSTLSPLILAWMIAALIRICVGSATVAGMTSAGIILPMVTGGLVNKELMVLAIGAGSLVLSHVNDGGFWLFKEYFNLSVKDTLLTWTVMETLISITGLGGVLILNIIV
jgi:Gnt-I system high-affinity gluconate transporter